MSVHPHTSHIALTYSTLNTSHKLAIRDTCHTIISTADFNPELCRKWKMSHQCGHTHTHTHMYTHTRTHNNKSSSFLQVESASSLLSSARNLMKAVVQVVKTCYVASKAVRPEAVVVVT